MNKVAGAALIVLLFSVSAKAQNFYEVVDLGVLPGQSFSAATDINNNGTVIGTSGNRSFMYRNCSKFDIGSLGGSSTFAEDLNDSDVVVGRSQRRDGRMRAFSFHEGVMRDLGGSLEVEGATAVSNFWGLGVPVGVESLANGLAASAVFYFAGVANPLPKFTVIPPSGTGPAEHVSDINDLLRITGHLRSSGNFVGLVSGTGLGQWTRVLGIPGMDTNVIPNAINEKGQIVGRSGNGTFHAFLSTNPSMPAVDLGTLAPGQQSSANDINQNGWSVGMSDLIAFLHNGTRMIDLNSLLINGSGWLLTEATAINDNNQIVGIGIHDGQVRAFLALPRRFPWLIINTPGCLSPPIFTRAASEAIR